MASRSVGAPAAGAGENSTAKERPASTLKASSSSYSSTYSSSSSPQSTHGTGSLNPSLEASTRLRHTRHAHFRAACGATTAAATSADAPAITAAASQNNCLSCVDCQKKFSIPDEFRVYMEDNFPSVWHCSDATWDLKLHKLCKIRAKRLADNNDDEAKRQQRVSRSVADDGAFPARKRSRTKGKMTKTKAKVRFETGVPGDDEAPELLIKGILSERLQMKVLLQLGVLAEQERKRRLRAAYFPSKREVVKMQEKETERRSALCFYCKSACSHSKLSLKLDLADLGLAEDPDVKDNTSLSSPSFSPATASSSSRKRSRSVSHFDTRSSSSSLSSSSSSSFSPSSFFSSSRAAVNDLSDEPPEDCVTVLGHLLHKRCLRKLQDEGLIVSLTAYDAGARSDIDLFAKNTRDAAFREDLACFRGLLDHPSLKMNAKYFEKRYLLSANGRKRVLVLEQDPEAVGLDLAESSTKTEILMSDYLKYQAAFCEKYASRRALYRERIFGNPAAAAATGAVGSSRGNHSTDVVDAGGVQGSDTRVGQFFARTRKFCSHLDLLPEDKWRHQHAELRKLPPWLYCQTNEDLLRYCRKPIPGMTSPQMYVKVPGVWTAAHEENNQFRSVNVNHGPGPCEWAGIASKHTPRLRELVLASHNIDIYKEEGRWVPPLDYLIQHKIPVITGMQNKSDLILVGIGCVHWVYSCGRATCTAWNVGELSYHMFDAAFKRWDENLKIGFPSLVPMHTLAYDVLWGALSGTMPDSQSTSSAQSVNSAKSKGPYSYCIGDFSPELLELLSERLNSAIASIENDLAQIKSFLPDLQIRPEPADEAWFPSHCSNPACARELFSVYVAIGRISAPTNSPTQAEYNPRQRVVHEYQCFCTQCALSLQNENQKTSASGKSEDGVVLTLFQRYTAERVQRLVASIRAALKCNGEE